jgi:predicted amidohydrolase YtcJ
LTLDAHDSIAQAIAVRTGVIVAVGADRDILRLAGTATQIIDLHGRMATPGLIDSHAHIAEGGIGELYDVQLTDATSVEEIVHRVQLGIATLKPGE